MGIESESDNAGVGNQWALLSWSKWSFGAHYPCKSTLYTHRLSSCYDVSARAHPNHLLLVDSWGFALLPSGSNLKSIGYKNTTTSIINCSAQLNTEAILKPAGTPASSDHTIHGVSGLMTSTSIALTIAGSDSGGGAGIQADLKTFSALGTYGCSVITALTAQNTLGVQGVFDITPEFVRLQLDSVFSDICISAIKVGMLSQPDIINVVAQAISDYDIHNLVVDPVMVATSGDVLLQANAIETLKSKLIPKARLITPNLPEAAVLLNCPQPETMEMMKTMVEPLLALGSSAVLLKGGHMIGREGKAIDLFHDGKELHALESSWVDTRNTHGTGCTLSSAITAFLAKGLSLQDAIYRGKEYVSAAITQADQLNVSNNPDSGHGPVHHFYQLWNR
ncbi:MAG: bifunctional hydroxymethylpyrimidine kinase/phosphomethylpyrimidine kinase [Endozoicomonas sp.]